MKMKSMAALAMSGLLMMTVSAPMFADDTSANSTDNSQTNSATTSDMHDSSQKSDNNGQTNDKSNDAGSQDTATGDDDY